MEHNVEVSVLTLKELTKRPLLAASMFSDRATQFSDRLRWSVSVNAIGQEMDEYDNSDAAYIVVCKGDQHVGSMRVHNVSPKGMLATRFGSLLLSAPVITLKNLEITRYCLSPSTRGIAVDVNRLLFDTAHSLAICRGVSGLVAVFDRRMIKIYRKHGWEPIILATTIDNQECISLGRWAVADWSKHDASTGDPKRTAQTELCLA